MQGVKNDIVKELGEEMNMSGGKWMWMKENGFHNKKFHKETALCKIRKGMDRKDEWRIRM